MVTIAIMIISTTVAMKVWSTVIQREKEEELIFRGKEYGQAIRLYQKMKGTFPTELKQLADKGPNNESIIRQIYKDPITGGDFGLMLAGPNGVPIPDEPIDDVEGDSTSLSGFNNPGIGAGTNTGTSTGTPAPAANPAHSFGNSNPPSAFGTPTASGPSGLGIMGVHSKSRAYAIAPAKWHDLERYNQWIFLSTDTVPGGQVVKPVTPGKPGGVGNVNPPRGATPGPNRTPTAGHDPDDEE
jgi:type II secretory pathway pseudopilin PulG